MEQTDDKYQELLESYETCREGGMSAEREAEIRETIRLMRARLAEFNVTQPATRLSLAMAEDLLAAFDETREALDEALAERDEARRAMDERDGDMHARIRAGYDKTIADCWRAKVAEVETERDKARRLAEETTADFASLEYDSAKVVDAYLNGDKCDLDEAVKSLMENGHTGWWESVLKR